MIHHGLINSIFPQTIFKNFRTEIMIMKVDREVCITPNVIKPTFDKKHNLAENI